MCSLGSGFKNHRAEFRWISSDCEFDVHVLGVHKSVCIVRRYIPSMSLGHDREPSIERRWLFQGESLC